MCFLHDERRNDPWIIFRPALLSSVALPACSQGLVHTFAKPYLILVFLEKCDNVIFVCVHFDVGRLGERTWWTIVASLDV